VVHNVLVRIAPAGERDRAPGRADTILLLAHYDSVAAGPGAGDDGAATAALVEVARVLHDAPPKQNPILIAWDDGEEAGLLGAKAFLESDPLAGDVAVVLNFEARGTSGPSLMFETGEDNAWLVDLFARVAPRPVTGSLFPAVYELLPNSTDFALFRRRRTAGLNFAFIGDAQSYHQPQDDLAHLDPRSVEHHAGNALAMVRALGDVDLARARRPGSAVFFDLLGLVVVRWPVGWSVPIGIVVALALVVALVRRRARLLTGLPTLLLPQAAAAVLLLAAWGARAVGLHPQQWTSAPGPYLVVAWAVPIVLLVPFVRQLRTRTDRFAAFAAVHLTLAVLGIVAAVLLPGASYVFVAPAAIASATALASAFAPERHAEAVLSASVIVASVAAGLLWFPVALLLYSALGLFVLPVVAGIVGLVASTVLPAFLPCGVPDRALLGRKVQGG
jgi:hypothetical protein